MSIPTELVDKDYQYDEATEIIVPNTHNLKNYMVVLLADPNHKMGLNQTLHRECFDFAMVLNRWCVVSEFEIVNELGFHIAQFRGLYGDETSFIRRGTGSAAWIVKKDSIIVDEKVFARAVRKPQYTTLSAGDDLLEETIEKQYQKALSRVTIP